MSEVPLLCCQWKGWVVNFTNRVWGCGVSQENGMCLTGRCVGEKEIDKERGKERERERGRG